MASFLYLKAKESFLSQNPSIDLDTDTINVVLINLATDNPSHANTMQYYSQITAYSGVSPVALGTSGTRSITNGVFDAPDVTFTAVAINGSRVVNGAVIYKSTGTASTSPLVAWIEFTSTITPNGGDISIAWDNGANKIFALN